MRRIWLGIGAAGISLVALGWKPQDDASKPEYYTAKVQPILEQNCYKCHGGPDHHRGGLRMDTRAALLTGGHHGAVIVPGDPDKSLLLTLAKHQGPADDPMPMPPPPRTQLTPDQIETVARWIKAGAVMPATASTP